MVADWPEDVVAGVADQAVDEAVDAELLVPELDFEVEPELDADAAEEELFAAAVAVADLTAMFIPSPRNAVTLRAAATTRARAAA